MSLPEVEKRRSCARRTTFFWANRHQKCTSLMMVVNKSGFKNRLGAEPSAICTCHEDLHYKYLIEIYWRPPSKIDIF